MNNVYSEIMLWINISIGDIYVSHRVIIKARMKQVYQDIFNKSFWNSNKF